MGYSVLTTWRRVRGSKSYTKSVSPRMASSHLIWALPLLFLLARSSESVDSCYTCTGDTKDLGKDSAICMAGEDFTPKSACEAGNNGGCLVKAIRDVDGRVVWERSCCSEASCQEKPDPDSGVYIESCETDNCNLMDPSQGALDHDAILEVPDNEKDLHVFEPRIQEDTEETTAEPEAEAEAESGATAKILLKSLMFVSFALYYI